jgi:hypothetical protein
MDLDGASGECQEGDVEAGGAVTTQAAQTDEDTRRRIVRSGFCGITATVRRS